MKRFLFFIFFIFDVYFFIQTSKAAETSLDSLKYCRIEKYRTELDKQKKDALFFCNQHPLRHIRHLCNVSNRNHEDRVKLGRMVAEINKTKIYISFLTSHGRKDNYFIDRAKLIIDHKTLQYSIDFGKDPC